MSSTFKSHQAAERRVETASRKVQEKVAEYERVQAEFHSEVAAIVEKWDARADTVEEMTIGLEKNDVTVSDLSLVWIPLP
jgi:hypothetical protein